MAGPSVAGDGASGVNGVSSGSGGNMKSGVDGLDEAGSATHGFQKAPAPSSYVQAPVQHPLRYAFAQAFGERGADHQAVVHDADMISAVQFSQRGDAIATGDKGGRIVILQKVDGNSRPRRHHRRKRTHRSAGSSSVLDPDAPQPPEPPEFRFWTQFQSHESEFDYLKSMEIEEKINEIQWCRQINGAYRLLSTNDKTIKLWRVSESAVRSIAEYAVDMYKAQRSSQPSFEVVPTNGKGKTPLSLGRSLEIPRLQVRGPTITAAARRTFANAHMFHINSLSISSDDVMFLTADDLRINLWNMEVGGPGLSILDIKPDNMEDLTEVITASIFHPRLCNIFMYSTSRGTVKLCDLRESALCNGCVREFEDAYDESESRFSEIVASISDIRFSPCGRYILTRDYLHLRLWDIAMEREPILTIPVEEGLATRLRDLYDSECVFDKFQCSFSCDGGSVVTGSYNSLLRSYSKETGETFSASASVDFVSGPSSRVQLTSDELGQLRKAISELPPQLCYFLTFHLWTVIGQAESEDLTDITRRVMRMSTCPTQQMLAAATGPALYIYSG